MTNLGILGASGHGRVVKEIAEKNGFIVKFFDDDISRISEAKIHGDFKSLLDDEAIQSCFIAIGENDIRKELTLKLLKSKKNVITLIDPSAIISNSAKIGIGVVVMPNVCINANSVINNGAIINTSASIDHDCMIGEYSHICPSSTLAGNVQVGKTTFIGTNSTIIPGIEIGDNVTIGAGSVVINSIGSDQIAYGNPAKIK